MTVTVIQFGNFSGSGTDLSFSLDQEPAEGNILVVFARAVETVPTGTEVLTISPQAAAPPYDAGMWTPNNPGAKTAGFPMGVTWLVVGSTPCPTDWMVEGLGSSFATIEVAYAEIQSDLDVVNAPATSGSFASYGASPLGVSTGYVGGTLRPDRNSIGAYSMSFEGSPVSGSLVPDGVDVAFPAFGTFPTDEFYVQSYETEPYGTSILATWTGGSDMGFLSVVMPLNASKYSIVQRSSTPGMKLARPTANNLLVATMYSTVELPEISGWTKISNGVFGAWTTLYWKVSNGSETVTELNLATAYASKAHILEATGFEDAPSLVASDVKTVLGTGSVGGTIKAAAQDVFLVSTFGLDSAPESGVSATFFPNAAGSNNVTFAGGFDWHRFYGPDNFFNYGYSVVSAWDGFHLGSQLTAMFVDGEAPDRPTGGDVYFCPLSVRGCALRLTMLNDSGVPVDPLTPNSRIQTAAFAELSLSPDVESGNESVKISPSGGAMSIIDRDCDVLKGMNLSLRLCGVPLTVLEMLTGTNSLMDGDTVVGGVWRDEKERSCVNLVMVELWSRNAGASCDDYGNPISGKWIQWVLPRTLKWSLGSNIEFNNGALDVVLDGYAEQNPAFYPSLPSGAFGSYVPGAGDPAGWPIGDPPAIIPDALSADPWTPSDQAAIQDGGPMAWRGVTDLPEPLSDCSYLDSARCTPETFNDGFCGQSEDWVGDDWTDESLLREGWDVSGDVGSFASPSPDSWYNAVTGSPDQVDAVIANGSVGCPSAGNTSTITTPILSSDTFSGDLPYGLHQYLTLDVYGAEPSTTVSVGLAFTHEYLDNPSSQLELSVEIVPNVGNWDVDVIVDGYTSQNVLTNVSWDEVVAQVQSMSLGVWVDSSDTITFKVESAPGAPAFTWTDNTSWGGFLVRGSIVNIVGSPLKVGRWEVRNNDVWPDSASAVLSGSCSIAEIPGLDQRASKTVLSDCCDVDGQMVSIGGTLSVSGDSSTPGNVLLWSLPWLGIEQSDGRTFALVPVGASIVDSGSGIVYLVMVVVDDDMTFVASSGFFLPLAVIPESDWGSGMYDLGMSWTSTGSVNVQIVLGESTLNYSVDNILDYMGSGGVLDVSAASVMFVSADDPISPVSHFNLTCGVLPDGSGVYLDPAVT